MSNPREISHSRGTSWEIIYRVDGRMVRQRFASKKLAESALSRARVAALDGLGITPADAKTTLADYAPRWLAAQQCRHSTLEMYSCHVRNHILPLLGRRPMGSLRRSDISAFIVQLTQKQLATATVVTIYRILAMILRSAVHDRLLVASPCYKIKLPGMPPARLQALTAEQVGDLLEHATQRDYAVLALGVGTGMRQGEALGLTLPHLRLLARELSVEKQCRIVAGGPPEITDELKTASSRRVLPLPAFVVAALARHIELYGLGPQDTLFCSPRGGIWRRGHFNDVVWKPALERAGLPHLWFSRAAPYVRLIPDRRGTASAGDPGSAGSQVHRGDNGHLRAPVP